MIRRLVLSLALAGGTAQADVPRPETLADTVGILAEAYKADHRISDVTVDTQDQSIRVTGPDGSDITSYPDNLHKGLQAAENDIERQQIVGDFVAALMDHLAGSEEESPDATTIVPLIRPAAFGAEAGDDAPISDPFVGDLRIFYAFDLPNSFSYVTPSLLDDVGLDGTELRDVATGNFEARGWAPEFEGDRVWVLEFDGNFEATFLLSDAIWHGLDEHLGTILMLALARDLVIFTDADFEDAAGEMRRIADENFEALSYPLSQMLFEWTVDGWKVHQSRVH